MQWSPSRQSAGGSRREFAPVPRGRDVDLEFSDNPARRGASGTRSSARSGSSRHASQLDPFVDDMGRAPPPSSHARAGHGRPSGHRRGRCGYARPQESLGDGYDLCSTSEAELDRDLGREAERDGRGGGAPSFKVAAVGALKGGGRRGDRGDFGDGSVVSGAPANVAVEMFTASADPAVATSWLAFLRPVLKVLCLLLFLGALAAKLLWTPPPPTTMPPPQLRPPLPPPPLDGPSPPPPPLPPARALPHPNANPPPAALVATLNRRFALGHATNNLSEAGVLVHQFGTRPPPGDPSLRLTAWASPGWRTAPPLRVARRTPGLPSPPVPLRSPPPFPLPLLPLFFSCRQTCMWAASPMPRMPSGRRAVAASGAPTLATACPPRSSIRACRSSSRSTVPASCLTRQRRAKRPPLGTPLPGCCPAPCARPVPRVSFLDPGLRPVTLALPPSRPLARPAVLRHPDDVPALVA